ncbi:hypothetical protein BSKO_07565 [Bryopsis sp. KO-2023]|nr:hypothetical protein BSKO_07565 [Bryopsis sp. KO-2023]
MGHNAEESEGSFGTLKRANRPSAPGPVLNAEAGQLQPPPQKRINEAFRLRLHEVKLVKRILLKVKAAMDSSTTSLATDETVKMNLHHLIEHSCPSKYIRALKMIDLIKNLTLYPNPHITKLAHYLLKRPEWGGKASDQSYRLIKPTSLNMMQNTDVVMVGDGVQDEVAAPHGHSEQGSFDGSEYNEMKEKDEECAEGSHGLVQERAGATGGAGGEDGLQNENCNDGDSESRHDGPAKKENPPIQAPQQEVKREGEGARDDYQDFDSLMLESDCSSMESSVGFQGGSGGT